MPPFLKLHALAATRGDGLRPEFQALFERLAAAPRSQFRVRSDGMIQAGPDPATPASDASKADEPPAVTKLATLAERQSD